MSVRAGRHSIFPCLLIALVAFATGLRAGTVTLEWDSNVDADVIGYNVYYGVVESGAAETVFVQSTTATLVDLAVGVPYFFYVTALNSVGLESDPSETITYTIPEPPAVVVNQPPVVNAGPDQTITLPSSATLNATVEDDGLPNPPGFVTTHWSTISGPGSVTFQDAGALSTTAAFSISGTYVLRLTADDGELIASDDVTISVLPAVEPPLAESQQVVTQQGTAVEITLRGVDPNNQPLSFIVASLPKNGTLSGMAPDLVYTPNPDFHGVDNFTFKASNGELVSGIATVEIEVHPAESEGGDEADNTLPDLAFITEFHDQTTPRRTSTHPIPFSLQSRGTPPDQLTFSVFSSDITLVPQKNVFIEGEGANRTLTILPSGNKTGTTRITVWVSDGKALAVQAFSVTVYGPLNLASLDGAPKQAAAISEVQFSPAQDSGQEALLRWSGPSGQIFAVETSSDLVNWAGTPASLHEPAPGTYEGRVLPEASGMRLFRLRWIQSK